MNWVNYQEQLGIGFSDDQKLQMCKNRINNIVSRFIWYREEDLYFYMNTVGEEYSLYDKGVMTPIACALYSVCKSKTLKEFISKYVAIINSAKDTCVTDDGERFLSRLLESAITGTLDAYQIPYDIISDNEGIYIIPKGIPSFDKELVLDTLQWLNSYPEAAKAWGNALKAYSANGQPSEVADLFRKALERFFQNFFNSEKSLEHLKAEYGRYLKDYGIPAEIVANFETLLQQYTTFINNHAKHHDDTNRLVLEYIMYQTGNMMRLLIKLVDEDKKNAI